MRIWLIRHGKTPGNLENRYVGTTDESLSEQGREDLLNGVRTGRYPVADSQTILFSSPMKRCLETAALLYSGIRPQIVTDLRECDFGAFEYRNYMEMKDDPAYISWVESSGTGCFPGGEDPARFRERSVKAFLQAIQSVSPDRQKAVIFVVHGGTIMAVMETLAVPERTYFDWQVSGGGGVECEWNPENGRLQWIRNL